MNRYFHLYSRVIVFRRGRSPGRSYFPDGEIGDIVWTLRDMKGYPISKEVSRRTARKIVKTIP